MKLRKTLSTLLAAALMCGLLCVPAMAASPAKVTGGSYYHTIELNNAQNNGTVMLSTYGSFEAARAVRMYTVQAGTTLTVTGDNYITVHPVTLMPDGTYQIKSVVTLAADGQHTGDYPINAPTHVTNDPQYLNQSEKWVSWTWYVPQYAHDLVIPDHLLPTHVTQTHTSSVVLDNSHAGTWMLMGGEVILKVEPVAVAQAGDISVYQVTSKSGLNIRSGAGTNYSKVGYMTYGTQFEVITSSIANGWGKLANGAGWAWLNGAKFLYTKGDCGVIGRQYATWTAANTYRVVANSLAIHDGPADGHKTVGTLAKGQLINIAEYYGENWGYLADGKGWVNVTAATVDFAEIKYASNVGNALNAAAADIQAQLTVKSATGIIPVRASNTYNSVVIGYLFNQADGSKVDLIAVSNDWGRLVVKDGLGVSGGWVYLPEAGSLSYGYVDKNEAAVPHA